jgi:mono/diheme cytochrome c family protein
MFQRIGSIFIILVLLFALVGISLASAEKGNARKGKYLYRKNCRTCHCEGGSAKPLSPIDKTQAQWDEVFQTTDTLPCKDQWAKLSDKDREDIYAHLWGHAYDSPSPAKCQ